MTRQFSIIDHQADTGLEVIGSTVEELFTAAAEGMFSIIIDPSLVKPGSTVTISVKAGCYEDLLLRWLQELLCRFEIDHFIFRTFLLEISSDSDGALILNANCMGEITDTRRHFFNTEIKSTVYHMLKVTKHEDKWFGKVIFDL